MNSTEAKMQSRRQSEEDGELSDEVNWSTEEKPILTEGLRRSRRQVSFPSSSDSSSAHTPPNTQLTRWDHVGSSNAERVTNRESSVRRN